MKIALMNEFSQASKNHIILEKLNLVAERQSHKVYNIGMHHDNDHYLTYIHLGIMSALLLNSRAVDFVVTGCGTGQGALMSLNAYPGVVCGYCIDPIDAFLFAQINNGNALSLPFAKGFGWGAELNLEYIFEKIFSIDKGQGYPLERKESQNRNAATLFKIKEMIVSRSYQEILHSIDQDLVKQSLAGKAFQQCFFENCQDKALNELVKSYL